MQKSALVVGLGLSGKAAKALLEQQGWRVSTLDAQGNADYRSFLEISSSFELAVLSPGIPYTHPDVQAICKKGIPIVGEAELGARFLRSKAVGITGTNGKTTVTALIAHVLNQCGSAAQAIGNIGVPITEFVQNPLHAQKIAVIELSSYQLETLDTRCLDAGVILNITPDHLDRYGTLEEYAQAKWRIQKSLKEGSPLFVDALVAQRWQIGQVYHSANASFEERNTQAALQLCRCLGLSDAAFWEGAKSFVKARHRLERVGSVGGIEWINDSKATNVDAVTQALHQLKGPLILLAGGRDKGGSYAPWLEAMQGKVKAVCLFGEAAKKIAGELASRNDLHIFETLKEALLYANRIACSGDTVLLSPGCASFDQYSDYKARGDEFVSLVTSLKRRS